MLDTKPEDMGLGFQSEGKFILSAALSDNYGSNSETEHSPQETSDGTMNEVGELPPLSQNFLQKVSKKVKDKMLPHDFTKSPKLYSSTPSGIRRTFSGSSVASISRRLSLSDDEFALSGPVSIRRNSGMARKSSEGFIFSSPSSNYSCGSLDDHEDFPVVQRDTKGFDCNAGTPFGSATTLVPESLMNGIPFLRITHRKKTQRLFRIDPDTGTVSWDSKASSKFSIDKINEIRIGDDARNYREELKISSEHENRWATIIYQKTDSKLKALHIVGATDNEFQVFVHVLTQQVKARQEIMSGLAMPGEKFVDVHWPKYVIKDDGEERLSFESVEKISKQLHINCSSNFLHEKFKEADVDCSGFLNFAEFQDFVRLLKSRKDINEVYEDFVTERSVIDKKAFYTFMKRVQGIYNEHVILKAFNKHCNDEGIITKESFTDMLSSLSLFPAIQASVMETDMTHPLNEYFISSSHNTYLLRRQVVGPSSVEGYIRALQSGCRCVEIDCWDGLDGSGPVVCHGRRLTSSIDFGDVIHVLRKYAFISTPYPLILSLEVHCGATNQLKMVDTLKSVFDDMLVTAPVNGNTTQLPSPEELKHRVLVKVKARSVDGVGVGGDGAGDGEYNEGEESDGFTSSSETAEFSDASTHWIWRKRKLGRKSGSIDYTNIIPPLAELGVYLSGTKYRNSSLLACKSFNHCYSVSERRLNSICRDESRRNMVVKHNRKYMMRVYPSAYRIKSTNFDPVPYWRTGVQLVALNWQTFDIGLQINEALFGAMANPSGYVLKGDDMQPKGQQWARSRAFSRKQGEAKKKLTLKIISAQQLPRPKELRVGESLDPRVEVELFGVPEHGIKVQDDKALPFKTQSIVDNGFNPTWNEGFSLTIPAEDYDFAFIRFAVYTRDIMFAVYTARVKNLQQGYRHVQLQDLHGEEYIFSRLFVRLS